MKAGEKQRTQRKTTAVLVPVVPVPLKVVTCPTCGGDVDLWTVDDETRCAVCNQVIHKRQRTNH